MNRRSSGFQFSRAFLGFEQYKAAEGLSPNTLVNYRQHLRLFLEFGRDVDVSQVTTQDIRAFLAWQRTDRKPKRFARQPCISRCILGSGHDSGPNGD